MREFDYLLKRLLVSGDDRRVIYHVRLRAPNQESRLPSDGQEVSMRNRSIARTALLGLLLTAAGSPARAADTQPGGNGGGTPGAAPEVKLNRTEDGLLAVGQSAPDFTLADATGHPVRLNDLRGTPVVLYFYPMDDTPGCTKEACAFRDDAARYDSLGVRVIGVSTDDPASHRAFATKHKLPFTLLADTTGAVVRLYGTGVEIEQRGSKRWIANRVTYLIDAGGAIRQVWPRVNPVGHSMEILAAWAKLPPTTLKGRD
jgi:peroxiredoxin Q/BCP